MLTERKKIEQILNALCDRASEGIKRISDVCNALKSRSAEFGKSLFLLEISQLFKGYGEIKRYLTMRLQRPFSF